MSIKTQYPTSLDPQWIAKIYSDTSGEDFLGLRSVLTNITSYLLPGIITITPRARYYSFYSWLLTEYSESHPPGWSLGQFIRRREQIFTLANLAFREVASIDPGIAGLTGQTKLLPHWQDHRDLAAIPLSVDDYIDASQGGFGDYSGVMKALEIYRQSEENREDLVVLPNGTHLTKAFAKAIEDTMYYQQRTEYDLADSIPKSALIEYGERCHLSYLSKYPDGAATRQVLFGFDAPHILPPPQSNSPQHGNMQGSLGLILDMLDQAREPFEEDNFRQAVVYGLCTDYEPYQPKQALMPFLAHWQMSQLREYYVYAFYALWSYFLRWLDEQNRPQPFQSFQNHLNEAVDLSIPAKALGLSVSSRSLEKWSLQEWLTTLLNAAAIPESNWVTRYSTFAQKSQTPIAEHTLYRILETTTVNDPAGYVGTAWILLSTLFLRLAGLRSTGQWEAWYWAKEGEYRRRSMHLFTIDMLDHMAAGDSLLDTSTRLYREYIIGQHIITALDKWRQRRANTFHFTYNEGLFEYVEKDSTGFSASRFRYARNMLEDLGLFSLDPETQIPQLTSLGKQTLDYVLENCGDRFGRSSPTKLDNR